MDLRIGAGAFTMDNVTSILAPEHAKALWMSLLLAFYQQPDMFNNLSSARFDSQK